MEKRLSDLKAELKAVVVSNPAEMTAQQLWRDYREMNGRNVPLADFGHSSLVEFLNSECGDTFQLTGNHNNPTLRPVITENIRNLNALITKQKPTKSRFPTRRRGFVMEPETDCSSDASSERKFRNRNRNRAKQPQKSPPIYDDTVQVTQRSQQIHKNSEKRSNCMSQYKCKSPSPRRTDFKEETVRSNQPKRNHNRSEKYTSCASTSEALPYISLDSEEQFDDCMFEDTIETPPSITTKSCDVYIAQVTDPSHFWFQVITEAVDKSLYGLHAQMTNFYRKSQCYDMPRKFIKPGMLCAVPYNKVYHRAKILSIINEDIVKVNYIDFCTVESVNVKDIRFLLKSFSNLPAQAYRGRLAFIKPVSGVWSENASDHFYNLVVNKKLTAGILDIDKKKSIYTIDLVERAPKTDNVFIAEVLLANNLAELLGGTKICDKRSISYFDVLETGGSIPVENTESEDPKTESVQSNETPRCEKFWNPYKCFSADGDQNARQIAPLEKAPFHLFEDPPDKESRAQKMFDFNEIEYALNSDAAANNTYHHQKDLQLNNFGNYIGNTTPSRPLDYKNINNYPNQFNESSTSLLNCSRLCNDINTPVNIRDDLRKTTDIREHNLKLENPMLKFEKNYSPHKNMSPRYRIQNDNSTNHHELILMNVACISNNYLEVWKFNTSVNGNTNSFLCVIVEQILYTFFNRSEIQSTMEELYSSPYSAYQFYRVNIINNIFNVSGRIKTIGYSGCIIGHQIQAELLGSTSFNDSNSILLLPFESLLSFLMNYSLRLNVSPRYFKSVIFNILKEEQEKIYT